MLSATTRASVIFARCPALPVLTSGSRLDMKPPVDPGFALSRKNWHHPTITAIRVIPERAQAIPEEGLPGLFRAVRPPLRPPVNSYPATHGWQGTVDFGS
jgi:hypothetical protein